MGIIRSVIKSATGPDQVNNGFSSSRLPFRGSNDNLRPTNHTERYPLPLRGTSNSPSGHQYSDSTNFYSTQSYRESPSPNSTSYYPTSSRTDQSRYELYDDRSRRFSEEEMKGPTFDKGNAEGRQQSQLDGPPPYESRQTYDDRVNMPVHIDNRRNEHSSRMSFPQTQIYSRNSNFRPLALPQIGYGDGQPFLRGYSDELREYGVSEQDFFRILDAINVAIIPNPEAQLFQKAANIGGWFIPGLGAGIGLMAGQVGVGIGTGILHSKGVAKVLSTANLELFVPNGLEICIGHTNNVDEEVGQSGFGGQQQMSQHMTPEAKLSSYGGLLAPLSVVTPPRKGNGRNDPIAMLGQNMSNRDSQRRVSRAEKRSAKGRHDKSNTLANDLTWLIVRRASPGAVQQWQNILQQSDNASAQKQISPYSQRT